LEQGKKITTDGKGNFAVVPGPGPGPGATWEGVLEMARSEAQLATAALKKSVEHALLAGMALAWLKTQTSHGPGGDRKSSDPLDSFAKALEQVGIVRMTAYRWIRAFEAALMRANQWDASCYYSLQNMPEPGTYKWREVQGVLEEVASKSTSLKRLMLGFGGVGAAVSEVRRYDELLAAEEGGNATAMEALEKVESGEWNLETAMRALGGAEATKGKERRDPVYLRMDGRTGDLGGLMPKALVTLRNGFTVWDELDEPARRKLRGAWLETLENLPEELR